MVISSFLFHSQVDFAISPLPNHPFRFRKEELQRAGEDVAAASEALKLLEDSGRPGSDGWMQSIPILVFR